MAKLVVEVLDATDLMPKDPDGSASPFVEVNFEGQRQSTQTKVKDLSPVWNEKFVFKVSNLKDLASSILDVYMYNDRKGGQHKNFLGRVRISGVSVPVETEAMVQRYPLEKRGIFSNIRGDIGLKVYVVSDPSFSSAMGYNVTNIIDPPLEEIPSNKFVEEKIINEEKKKKKKEVRTFHSIGTTMGGMGAPPPYVGAPPPLFPGFANKPVLVEKRNEFPRPGQANTMHMQFPGQPEFGLVETRPPVAARLGYRGGNKISSTFDLVEQMHFLYVKVVKARELPSKDVTGSLDPYVEVKLGNYKGITKHFEKNQNPVWNEVFAFSKEHLQSNLLEVLVKDKDIGVDDFVGRIIFDLSEVPLRVPPDSPLAPQWYRLEDKKGEKARGEVMLAVWMGTQADETFPEAWHSDAHWIGQDSLSNTRSKVYFSPKLFYLRMHIIEAQDLVPSDKGRIPNTYVKIQIGNQLRVTRPSGMSSFNPIWNDELMFVVPEPLDELIVITVENRVGSNQDEILGRLILPVSVARQRFDYKPVEARWFNLEKSSSHTEESASGEKKKELRFSSKIHIQMCIDAGYHVLDEATHYSSDLQPSAKQFRKPSIGVLELGILSAKNLLPMKAKIGRATDAYCVAKYGNKWVRTRTILDSLAPQWNEQYTWDVHDPCTVITIGVFDNCHISGNHDSRDQRIGKVRVRLSTLEADRVYTHYYPLLALHPSGLKKTGELHLALRFTCTSWVNMVSLYTMPLLPKMHYVQPIPVRHIDWLRHQAMQIVAARLSRAEPPLRKETVEYMLDTDYHMWSLRRSKANFNRIMSLLSGFIAIFKWFDDIRNWKNPVTTCLVHVLFLLLVFYPELILPTVFLYLFMIGIRNYRYRPRNPPHMDAQLSHADRAHPDELDEEFDTFPTSRPPDIVRMRYDRLRSVAGRIQTVAGDLATQVERAQTILSWRDSRATSIFIILSLMWAVFLYVTPIQVVALLAGLYFLRHPRFRNKMPSVPFNFYRRLPSKSDMLL